MTKGAVEAGVHAGTRKAFPDAAGAARAPVLCDAHDDGRREGDGEEVLKARALLLHPRQLHGADLRARS